MLWHYPLGSLGNVLQAPVLGCFNSQTQLHTVARIPAHQLKSALLNKRQVTPHKRKAIVHYLSNCTALCWWRRWCVCLRFRTAPEPCSRSTAVTLTQGLCLNGKTTAMARGNGWSTSTKIILYLAGLRTYFVHIFTLRGGLSAQRMACTATLPRHDLLTRSHCDEYIAWRTSVLQ